MTNLEVELTKTSTSRFYDVFDLSHGYWKFSPHEYLQNCQSFVTPNGIYTPTRLLHGTNNAVTYLQSTLAAILAASIFHNILYWIEDIMCHAATITELFQTTSKMLGLLDNHNLKRHPDRCDLFFTEIF